MSLLTFLSCFLDVIDSHGFGIVPVLDLNYSRLYVVPRFCKSVWITHYPGVVPVTFVIFCLSCNQFSLKEIFLLILPDFTFL